MGMQLDAVIMGRGSRSGKQKEQEHDSPPKQRAGDGRDRRGGVD